MISSDMVTPRKQRPVESRLEDWGNQRYNRLKDLRDIALEDERITCPFTPEVQRYTPSPKPDYKKGTEVFLER